MVDLSDTVIAKSDQQNADDYVSGPRTFIIDRVTKVASKDQPISIHLHGEEGKPYKPNKTMRRLLMAAWGKDGSEYAGRRITIYRDPSVKWAGEAVGGLRISHLSHIDKDLTVALTVTRGRKKGFTVKRLADSGGDGAAPNYDAEKRELEDAAKRGRDVLRTTYERIKRDNPDALKSLMSFVRFKDGLNKTADEADAKIDEDDNIEANLDGDFDLDDEVPF